MDVAPETPPSGFEAWALDYGYDHPVVFNFVFKKKYDQTWTYLEARVLTDWLMLR